MYSNAIKTRKPSGCAHVLQGSAKMVSPRFRGWHAKKFWLYGGIFGKSFTKPREINRLLRDSVDGGKIVLDIIYPLFTRECKGWDHPSTAAPSVGLPLSDVPEGRTMNIFCRNFVQLSSRGEEKRTEIEDRQR